jgi:DNA primase
MISKESIAKLKEQTDIVDIISSAIELKKNGANFKACCPFHGEDTPSFVVSPVKQIYHCFGGCGGGDAIKFIQEYHKFSYPEAIEHIANEMNFTLEYDNNVEKKDYKNIIETINSYYVKNLKDQELKYLQDRGVTKESIEKFEIGFATDSKSQIEYLKNNFLNIQDAQDIGVLSLGEKGLYSRLINRITFPIRNHTNKLIGFGGRTTTGHSAKYVNSIQTKLFDKSRNLYGLNLAKEHIYKKGTAVITEGYLDVVMMHQAGIQTTVATMGTALTEQHIPIIKRMNCKALLCFDGDKAGKVAAYKASVLLSKHLIDGSVVIFDDGIDPADMVKENRVKELISLMMNGTPLINYALGHIVKEFDIKNPLEKDKAKKECIDFLNSLNNPVIANEYRPFISHILNIDIKYIQLDNPRAKTPAAQTKTSSQNENLELSIIASTLESFNSLDLVMNHCKKDMFSSYQKELEQLIDCKDIESLEWVSLKDGVKIYKDKEFKVQLCILLVDCKQKEIEEVKVSSKSIEEKISEVKALQMQIFEYKRGEI